MKIIKRNSTEVDFDINKIIIAISKANKEVKKKEQLSKKDINEIAAKIEQIGSERKRPLNVEEIQDLVETGIMEHDAFEVAKCYIKYRYERELVRKSNSTDEKILALINDTNEEAKQENANKNPRVNSTMRDYIAGEVSRDITNRILLPKDIVDAHNEGIIHFHDQDYFIQHMGNCCLVNLEDMFQNGTVINGRAIRTPKSFRTACTLMTQISAQIASVQYGGQTMTLTHLAPFVDISRQKHRKKVAEEFKDILNLPENEFTEKVNEIAEKRLKDEIKDGVQTIQYQIETIMSSNGQAPFITIFLYLGETDKYKEDLAMIFEEVLKQRCEGIENEKGYKVTPAFPKLIYVLEKDNISEDSKYWYLTELAAKCTAKRMVPDYISEKKMLELKIDANGNGNCYPCMGCRSFLTPHIDENGKPKYYGRWNQGVVTINLVDVACSADSEEEFWKILDERLELCHKGLQYRHKRLKDTVSDVAPILWQNGALARLKKGETINNLLYNNYSTISLGYAGLWECVYKITGKKLIEPEGKEFGLKIMKKLNEACAKWREAENISYSLYGTPIESTTYKFAKCLQKRFGIIEGVTDKSYITNSYHIHVTEPVDAFYKLKFEAEFQELSPGGCISYVEVPNMQDNIPAVLEIIKFIYDNIMYAELNTKSDFCQICDYDGEIEIVEKNGKYIWKCPNCGNEDQNKMNVARRTCGYIGTQYFNQGRTMEIRERCLHLGEN